MGTSSEGQSERRDSCCSRRRACEKPKSIRLSSDVSVQCSQTQTGIFRDSLTKVSIPSREPSTTLGKLVQFRKGLGMASLASASSFRPCSSGAWAAWARVTASYPSWPRPRRRARAHGHRRRIDPPPRSRIKPPEVSRTPRTSRSTTPHPARASQRLDPARAPSLNDSREPVTHVCMIWQLASRAHTSGQVGASNPTWPRGSSSPFFDRAGALRPPRPLGTPPPRDRAPERARIRMPA